MKQEMMAFERRFAEALSGSVLPMDEVLQYVASARGKRLRPRLVFMSARLFGEVNEATRRTALFVELLHTATLIHDDVVDGSDQRRGQPSVNVRWDNKTAVLVGDYLLSKAIQVLADPADRRILNEMLGTAMVMSEGELLQSAASRKDVLSANQYLDIIKRKTARLMKACCVGGALSVGATDEQVAAVGEFGLSYGMMFQMRDDIADDDDPTVTALAIQLLPEYQEKTRNALKSLSYSMLLMRNSMGHKESL